MIDQQLRANHSHELDEESMNKAIAPLVGADDNDNEAVLNSSPARQRAAAVFSFPSVSNRYQPTEKNEDEPMFRDIARTTLPIEFQGQEVKLLSPGRLASSSEFCPSWANNSHLLGQLTSEAKK